MPEDSTGSIYAGLHLVRAVVAWSRGEPIADPSGYSELGDAYDRAAILGIRALHHAQAGDPGEGARLSDEGLRDYHASYGYEDDLVLFWSLAVELALLANDLPRVRSLLGLADAAPSATRTPLLTGHQSLYRGLLAEREGRDAEPLLREAVDRLTSYGARFRAAQAQFALASLLAEGNSAESAALLDEATATFTRLRATLPPQDVARVREPAAG
jgi:hypothetical protein